MGSWVRRASFMIALPMMLAMVPMSASAADHDPGAIARQKRSILTPALQGLVDGQPASKGPVTPVAPSSEEPGAPITKANGRVLVDVRLGSLSPEVLDNLRAAGARITFVDRSMLTVTAAVDPADLPALAASAPQVISVREVLRPMTNAACPSGDFVSEGVAQLRAALARSQFSVDGSGVTVGVLSDSYNRLAGAATDVSNGELPGVTNPCGHPTAVGNLVEGPIGSADEGRAMAQIVHDVAPGARILFASAFNGESAFAQSIRDLATAGADVIVDDITYFDEPMFQDGVVAKAVRDVTAAGVVYFSSAANSNLIIGGNRVASYEAPAYRPMGCPTGITSTYGSGVTCHDFNPGAGTDALYDLAFSSALRYSLGWSEPQNGVVTDLDLCLTNPAGTTVYGCANDYNGTTGLAHEFASFNGSGNVAWVIVRFSGAATPRLKLISHRSTLTSVQYSVGSGGDIVGPTIFGHNASIPGATVAAVPYNNSNVLESYSSFGPALYCWQPVDGSTPSGPLDPCQGATVDLTATDGGLNSFFGSGPPYRFYGTSAAAPHAAAVAALAIDSKPCLSQDQVLDAMAASGRAVGNAPVDGAGAGLVDAVTALGAASCDNSAPAVDAGLAAGWYKTPTVSATAVAQGPRRVADLSCTGVTTDAPTGLNTNRATAAWSVSGEGQHTVSCSAKDTLGKTGGPATVDFGIDVTPPAVVCRPMTIPLRSRKAVSAKVTDAVSGPAATTTSANVSTRKTGRFSVTLSGADVAGNTATATCGYTVAVVPQLKGPAKARAGATKRYKVSGLPGKAKVKWTVKLKGKKVAAKKLRANKSGVARLTVNLATKGKYVVTVRSAGASARKTVRVR